MGGEGGGGRRGSKRQKNVFGPYGAIRGVGVGVGVRGPLASSLDPPLINNYPRSQEKKVALKHTHTRTHSQTHSLTRESKYSV